MAKTSAKSQSQAAERERPADPERGPRFLLIGGVAAVLLIVAGLIGFGWYQTQIRPLDKVVLKVGETKFNLAHVERRMSQELDRNPAYLQSVNALQALPNVVINELEREAKLLEAAAELDIAVTDEDVDARIRELGSLGDNAEPGEFVSALDQQVNESGLRENEYLQMLRADLLEEKVLEHFTEQAPEREPQVLGRWIVLEEQEQADEALQRLEAGDEFATVASDLSIDTFTADQGGDIGWRARGGFFDQALEDFLFEAEPGQRSDIISTHSGLYILELLERDEDRELDDFQSQVVVNREMTDWLQGLDVTLDIDRDFTTEDSNRALNDIL